jgi:hypothetical protein
MFKESIAKLSGDKFQGLGKWLLQRGWLGL